MPKVKKVRKPRVKQEIATEELVGSQGEQTENTQLKPMPKKLALAIKNLEKKFGDGIVKRASSESLTINKLPTGIKSLDLALGGGIPIGMITEFYGEESGGKSTIIAKVIAEAQQHGHLVCYLDAEHCVSGDTLLFNPLTGEIESIQSIVAKKEAFSVFSYNENKKIVEIKKISKFYSLGSKQAVEITLKNGNKLKCTPEHKIFVNGNFVEASQIKPNDLVFLNKHYIHRAISATSKKTTANLDMYYLVGLFLGDGCFLSGSPRFSNVDKKLISCVDGILSNIDCKLVREKKDDCGYRVVKTNPIKRWKKCDLNLFFKDIGLEGLKRDKKHIPPALYACNDKGIYAQIIAGLIDSDGTVSKNKQTIGFSNISRKLVYQVRHLLLLFGISSWVRSFKDKKSNFLQYVLLIHGKDNICKFANNIILRGVKKERIHNLLNRRLTFSFYDYLPNNVLTKLKLYFSDNGVSVGDVRRCLCTKKNKKGFFPNKNLSIDGLNKIVNGFCIKDDTLAHITNDKLQAVPVRSVRQINDIPVYDIEVEDNHNYFTADGVLIHNCLDKEWLEKLGVNWGAMLHSEVTDADNVFDIAKGLIQSNEIKVLVVDSVAALTPKKEVEEDMSKQSMGVVARIMSKGLRVSNTVNTRQGTAIIFINQTREKIGIMFGDNRTTPGGKALRFFAGIRVDVKRGEWWPDKSKPLDRKGVEIIARVVKNKTSCPYKESRFVLMTDGVIKEWDELRKSDNVEK